MTLLCLLQGVSSLANYAEDLEVLHWWTSDGERAAALYLQDTLAEQGITWVDAAIPGGGGEGAMAVLKSRVLQGAAPAAAQIIGPDIQNWAALGFLGHFNIVALAHDWPNILHPTVNQLLQYQGQYVAVPFGIHRINGLWVNRALLAETGLAVPQHWDEFFTRPSFLSNVSARGFRPSFPSDRQHPIGNCDFKKARPRLEHTRP